MLYPMITIDYEVFGDGSGPIRETIVDPMNNIKRICDKYDLKTNIFLEFKEYEMMKSEKTIFPGLKQLESQILNLYKEGHDIQLHFHPQFMNAKYKIDSWEIDPDAYSIKDYIKKTGEKGIKRVENELWKGIQIIKDLVQDQSHEVIAYRAGGWNLEPEDIYIDILKTIGIKIDSSSYKGGMLKTGKHGFDYSKLHSDLGYWWTKKHTIQQTGHPEENLLEMPIYSINYSPFWYKKYLLLYNMSKKIKTNKYSKGSGGGFDFKALLYYIRSSIKWDFCKLSAKEMETFYKKALSYDKKHPDEIIPLIMIGHTKDFFNEKELDLFLKLLKTKYKTRLYTFKEINELIKASR